MKLKIFAAAMLALCGTAWGQSANDLANLQRQMGKPFDPQYGRMKALTFHAFAEIKKALDNIKASGVEFSTLPKSDPDDYNINSKKMVEFETTAGGVPIAVDKHGSGDGSDDVDVGAINEVLFKPMHGRIIHVMIIATFIKPNVRFGGHACDYNVLAFSDNYIPEYNKYDPYLYLDGANSLSGIPCRRAVSPRVDAEIQLIIQRAIYVDLKTAENN